MAKFTYWVGWEADANIPDEDKLASWPKGMKGWTSGYGDGYTTYCARVDADTAKEAEKIVRSCYGKHAGKIRMRWDPSEHQHEIGWRDTSGRFPE